MYDEPTREGSSDNLMEYGTAFAGRGGDLNEALADLDPLVRVLEPGRPQPRGARDEVRGPLPGLRAGGGARSRRSPRSRACSSAT